MKVVVRADSWHYKVWKWAQDPFVLFDRWADDAPTVDQLKRRAKEPTAICGYFWTIVLAPPAFLFFLLTIGVVACVIAAIAGLSWLVNRGVKRLAGSVKRRPQVVEPISVAAAFAKAKKQRVCPLIEVRRP